MSGGRFEYVQFRFGEIVESIRSTIVNNDSTEKDEWGEDIGTHLPPDIIAKFAETAEAVERAEKMVTRVDWLLSGDDGEDCFRRRWKEEGLDGPNVELSFKKGAKRAVVHTPGPWKIHGDGKRRDRYLAVIDSIPDREGKVVANCICHVAVSNPDADANAAAIADVPAMLHVLRELVDFAEVDEHHRYHERSKAAFSRAYDLLEKHGG